MKSSFNLIVAIMSVVTILSFGSCANEDVEPSTTTRSTDQVSVDFVAHFTPQQEAALLETGSPFGDKEQKDSWNNQIDPQIPVCWGLFDLPESTDTRAVGIYGSYPAQFWTMLRVKLLKLPKNIKDGAILAIDQLEATTNVRFYNSIEDVLTVKGQGHR